ncbi:MAG: 50S ribosomal protein L21 [Lentisphaerae bacterium]|nr:50S ribosomal protein L21 [Lentisphaerota bacterium]MCP4099842.1 50S ribosomal protein L21 [Lentisphaerota bacterium]
MYAIVKTGGKQYKVKPDDVVEIERIEGEAGSKIVFEEVLAVGEENDSLNIGTPIVEGAKVEAEIVEQFRGPKLIAFKMKKRKGYRRKKGHRQELTRVKIAAVNAG